MVAQPARCAVVGAGLAGAAVARALALRGWQVTVLDRAAQPAAAHPACRPAWWRRTCRPTTDHCRA